MQLDSLFKQKLPLGILLCNACLIIAAVYAATNMLNQFERNTDTIESLSWQVQAVEERMVERMELDDALMRVDNAITNASYVSERIQRLETLRENEEGDAWTKDEVDRQITELKERLAVVDVNIQKMQEDLWEIDDINYLKERLAVLESQVVTVDLSHVNSQIDEVRRIVADMWGPLTNVEQSVFSLEERVLLLENIGNHAKLIEKANKNR